MIINIEQVKKDLFSAKFIFREVSGRMFLEEHLYGSLREIKVEITYNNKKIFLKSFDNTKERYAPYEIYVNDRYKGMIFQTYDRVKQYSYLCLTLKDCDDVYYNAYPISFGKSGMCCPIYKGSEEIAQISKGCIVHNDLHNYKIIATEDELVGILFSIYLYANNAYKSGVKMEKGVVIEVEPIERNNYLLEKYNPEFEKEYE